MTKKIRNAVDQVTINPGLLQGQVTLPISKSFAHRVILAKALAVATGSKMTTEATGPKVNLDSPSNSTLDLGLDLDSDLKTLNLADDIIRTIDGANELISSNSPCTIYCKDSGTTLRMIMPIACALHDQVEITVTKELAKRPLGPLITVLENSGCKINIKENLDGTFTYYSHGKFQGGQCQIPGNISSQYISGLLYALPLTETGGEIHLTTELASKPYLDMTLAVLKDFGVTIHCRETNDLLVFSLLGKQKFKNANANVNQGDWSAAAFFAVANALGSQVEMTNLDFDSLQGDKAIYRFIDKIKINEQPVIDLEDYPDLFPVLAILASYQRKTTTFTGISRLKLKESNRIASTTAMLKVLQGEFTVESDAKVKIQGNGSLKGGTVDSFNDHRIAMAAAIAATKADGPVTILDSSCCDKSYPDFFQDYGNLGGHIG